MEKSPASFYTIRFSDCDPFGHLNNARYIDYFLNAREDHLKKAYQLDLKKFYHQGMSWLVGGHEINYLKPADYNETVRIETTLLGVAPDSLLVEMVMTDENQTHIKSVMHTRFIHVNLKTGKRDNHNDDFMQFAQSITTGKSDVTFANRIKQLVISMKNVSKETVD